MATLQERLHHSENFEEPTNLFGKPLETYPPLVKKYFELAKQLPCNLNLQQELVIYAIYIYGTHLISRPPSLEEVAQIFGLKPNEVKKRIEQLNNLYEPLLTSYESSIIEHLHKARTYKKRKNTSKPKF